MPTPTIPKLSDITWLHANIADWKRTSVITKATFGHDRGITLEHSMAGKWPLVGEAEGNPWVIAFVNGKWWAATYEWLTKGQVSKLGGKERDEETKQETGRWKIDTIGPHTKKEPLRTWFPKPGELVGFCVSTLARDSRRSPSNERTGIVWAKWFEDGIVAREEEPATTPASAPQPTPTPAPPVPAPTPVTPPVAITPETLSPGDAQILALLGAMNTKLDALDDRVDQLNRKADALAQQATQLIDQATVLTKLAGLLNRAPE
jgi:hypothetical protein